MRSYFDIQVSVVKKMMALGLKGKPNCCLLGKRCMFDPSLNPDRHPSSHQWAVIRTVYTAGTLNSCLSLPDTKRYLLTKQVHDKKSLSDELGKRTGNDLVFLRTDNKPVSRSMDHIMTRLLRRMRRFCCSDIKCDMTQRL